MKQRTDRLTSALRRSFGVRIIVPALAALSILLGSAALNVLAQAQFEGREVRDISIVFTGTDSSPSAAERYRLLAREAIGSTYAAVRVRDAIAAIYATDEVFSIAVEAFEVGNLVDLRFVVRRKTRAARVRIVVEPVPDRTITEQELLLRLNLLDPGSAVSEASLRENADLIVEYLRERGYFRAEAGYEQRPLDTETQVEVTFNVRPGTQATVEAFNINIAGITAAELNARLRLTPGSPFTREELGRDVDRIREALQRAGFLAPTLNEPRVIYDSQTNTITIDMTGQAGPTVEVIVDTERERIGSGTQRRLLPIVREGTLDYAAIIEGERRLENHYQERGYFFVDVIATCSVDPPLIEGDDTVVPNDTEFLCSALGSAELSGRNVTVRYQVDLNRRLRLVDIRLTGTDQFTIDEIRTVLDSQEANILGIIPLFGYGRGYTSERILQQDAATIRSLLRELGYRDAEVRVNQGVSLDGEDLIITFVVDQGEPTIVSQVTVTGNSAFSDDRLLGLIPNIEGQNLSRAKIRNAQRRLSEFYSEAGYYDAVIEFSIDEETGRAIDGPNTVRVVFNVANEGVPVYIDRILVTGNEKTNTAAIERALTLRPGEHLRATDIYSSEQNLYSSDAFERVDIHPQPVGDRAGGGRLTDLIVDVTEQKPRLLQYGGGFSTDVGWSGFVDVRHFNLFGNLWQGGSQLRWSQRRQLFQMDFINPRFIRDGEKRFAPLTISLGYQRDTTVTRFFRSAFDRGTFGIVQRVDEDGNPIDEFGNPAGSPTLNRASFTAETNRTISVRDRSIVFFRYRLEDVRLYNIESLLIRDILRPDAKIRISGFGATFVRDTRRRCGIEYTVLEIIARGEPGEPCRYNASDPTDGSYFTAEYNVSAPVLGANIGFHKFQASYNYYYRIPRTKNTVLAARGILGLASVFSRREQFSSVQFPELDGLLPISERFFGGGANTLRGFDYESAGPRVVIVPEGEFRNSDGEPVFLDPFTVPFGGNALAVVNIEARVPVANWLRAVPFYDGGNVFRRIGDIFNPPSVPKDDVFRQNLRALWTHTVGLGFRVRTPVGTEIGFDYGYLLNPPRFLIPQKDAPNAIFQLPRGRFHFRFSQAF